MGDFFVGKKKECAIVISVILGVYVVLKFLSPLVAPFLFAFLIVAYLHPMLERIQKKLHIGKGFMSAIVIFFSCAVLVILLGCLCSFLCRKGVEIIGQMDVIMEKFGVLLNVCCKSIEDKFGYDGTYIENFIIEQANIQIENLEVNIMPKLMGGTFSYIKNLAGFFGFFAVIIISALLLVKDYDKIIKKAKACKEICCIWGIGSKVVVYIRTFLKAQLIIMSIISTVCAVTLWLSGIKGGILFGILTGLMDILPFIGTGIMLIPLAIYQFLSGYIGKGVICLVLYGVCALTREFLEPKLIGNKVGIWPVAILFAVYVGIQLFGLLGIIKGPIGLVIIFETYRYLKENREKGENPWERDMEFPN